jgi:hypothetical protein
LHGHAQPPIQVSTLHQQVVVDTTTGAFTTMNLNTITLSTPFVVGGHALRLGTVGETVRTVLSGHLNAPAPPSGYFAGYVTVTSAPPAHPGICSGAAAPDAPSAGRLTPLTEVLSD